MSTRVQIPEYEHPSAGRTGQGQGGDGRTSGAGGTASRDRGAQMDELRCRVDRQLSGFGSLWLTRGGPGTAQSVSGERDSIPTRGPPLQAPAIRPWLGCHSYYRLLDIFL